MNKKYLKHLFKSNKVLSIFVIISQIAIYGLSYFTMFGGKNDVRFVNANGLMLTILMGLTYILPVIIFSFVHNKKAVDTYFALPVTRKEILISNIIFMVAVIYLPFFILSMILGLISNIKIIYLLTILLVALVSGLSILIFNVGMLMIGNSLIDGVIIMIAYSFVPLMLQGLIVTVSNKIIYGFYEAIFDITMYSSMLMSTVNVTNGIYYLMKGVTFTISNSEIIGFITSCLIHLGLGIYSIKKNFLERKVERAESISDKFFAYPFIIHLYAVALIFIVSFSVYGEPTLSRVFKEAFIWYVLIWILYICAMFIYRRKLSIKLKSVVFIVVFSILSLLLVNITVKTEGFGLSYNYPRNPVNERIHYDRYINYSDSDLYRKISIQPEADASLEIFFDFDVTDREPKKAEMLEYFNLIRDESIKNYFNGDDQYVGYLDVYVNYNEAYPYSGSINYNYNNVKLTLEQLQYINDNFTEVHVNVDYYDAITGEWKYEEYTLNEILK
ncbi:MAG: hypothetical protein Q4B60_03340 [Erysipelotrichaceae bacterium]|nr:hypothetical protein [Erysipelotrichaceae bacterium]